MKITAGSRSLQKLELIHMISDWTLAGAERVPEIALECAGRLRVGELLGFNARRESIIILVEREDRPTLVPLADVDKMIVRIHGEAKWTIVNNRNRGKLPSRNTTCGWTMTKMERTIEAGPGV